MPTRTNPLGVKGAGESGTVGALPAVMNAVNDALAQIGAPYVQMPATRGEGVAGDPGDRTAARGMVAVAFAASVKFSGCARRVFNKSALLSRRKSGLSHWPDARIRHGRI